MPGLHRAPACRRLRAFTFDPDQSRDLDTAMINEAVIRLPWEELQPGPCGEYLEVIDRDPASDCFYLPVDLDDPYLLAKDGIDPSEGNPQFHQQMVYAVARLTIHNFERALGRTVLWSPRGGKEGGGEAKEEYVPALRCYPHALREPNAYYSPQKKALLFGYFRILGEAGPDQMPGGFVFTCLSHDVIAHETTHAILDGVHRRFIEPSNPDTLAFHEAFADIVALFQHFTFPEAVRNQIIRKRANLGEGNLLAELAGEFGRATGQRGALRSGLEHVTRRLTDEVKEPHERGAILLAAVFDAFVTIYRARIADLLRIADGHGARAGEDLHPDLVERLVVEAVTAAQHILGMCIRALDYCPPVDLTFGDYLRAMITADTDLSPGEGHDYRLAMVAAFRKRGVFPEDVRSLSAESLLWCPPRDYKEFPGLEGYDVKLSPDRISSFRRSQENRARLDGLLRGLLPASPEVVAAVEEEFGLLIDPAGAPLTIQRAEGGEHCRFEVHSVRVARRVLPDGAPRADLVVEITQQRRGYVDPEVQATADKTPWAEQAPEDFWFRGGCTLVVDVASGSIRFAICKRMQSGKRLERQRRYLRGLRGEGLAVTYLARGLVESGGEPFAFLHRCA